MKNNMGNLSGQTAIVTGAVGILGRQLCERLASLGSNLVLADRELANCQAFAEKLMSEHDIDCLPIGVNLADRVADREIIEAATAHFGESPRLLVNNAASKSASLDDFFTPDDDYSPETWREVMAVNLEAPFFLSCAFAKPLLASSQSGSIVNIASIYGHMSPDQRIYAGAEYMGKQITSPAVYSTSKAGILGMTRHLAGLWGGRGIRVNSVAPGGVFSGQNSRFEEQYSARVPMGRMAMPGEIAPTIAFLLSEESSYVNGQNWLVDGGLSAW
ncbi:SDR family oxidoreductase [Hoeflea sp.]|uniref:SDR family oxidoreductase n=1 Tax=Hoeflea sp. TaxID=1940281 RepID=UPI003BB1B733